jgi:hypothetical protein
LRSRPFWLPVPIKMDPTIFSRHISSNKNLSCSKANQYVELTSKFKPLHNSSIQTCIRLIISDKNLPDFPHHQKLYQIFHINENFAGFSTLTKTSNNFPEYITPLQLLR